MRRQPSTVGVGCPCETCRWQNTWIAIRGGAECALKEEGFARLPRRLDDERPDTPRPTAAAVADVRRLDLQPRQLRTKFGGLFLFVPYLAAIPFDDLLDEAG